jgi:4-hydroxybenzoate polyprenyltransferase
LLRTKPHLLLLLPFWLLRGRAHLKKELARRSLLDVSQLPYNRTVVDYLRRKKQDGARLVLATAANSALANKVSAHLGLFDEVIASTATENIKGVKKAAVITDRLQGAPFVYVGHSRADLAIWKHAASAVLVNASKSVAVKAGALTRVGDVFIEETSRAGRVLLRALRVHQWFKNLLIFVPIFTAHEFFNAGAWLSGAIAFTSFSLCASAVYLINDIADLENDRLHPTKRHRPLASGDLPLSVALLLAPALVAASASLSLLLSGRFMLVMAFYFAATLLYSLYLKRLLLLDVMLLAALYTIRIVAGLFATGLAVSHWLLAFSMFLFLSLALMKRYIELKEMNRNNRSKAIGRGYVVEDNELISKLGTTSGYLAVLVFALYINSDAVTRLYTNSLYLWAVCPLILYWISRIWILANRGQVHEDPIVFAIKDRASYVVVFLIALVMAAARLGPA